MTPRDTYTTDARVEDDPEAERPAIVEDRSRTTVAAVHAWSPAQILGLIVGIGFTVLGIAAVARTGFDTNHIYTPHDVVWRLPHSPLLAVCEIGFGVLLIIASVVPGAVRPLMALLGAISLAFGIVILTNGATTNLTRWFAVTHRSGWFFTIVGAVVVLVALFSPVFVTGSRETRRHGVRTVRAT